MVGGSKAKESKLCAARMCVSRQCVHSTISRKQPGCVTLWIQYHFYNALFLEQRLGKTYITIKDILNKPISKILIVTPYSAFLAWKIALEEFEQTSLQYIEGTKKQRLNDLGNLQKWNITNYQTSIKPELYNIDWDCCVLDESTYIKNPKAKMTKAFIKLGDKITYKYILK